MKEYHRVRTASSDEVERLPAPDGVEVAVSDLGGQMRGARWRSRWRPGLHGPETTNRHAVVASSAASTYSPSERPNQRRKPGRVVPDHPGALAPHLAELRIGPADERTIEADSVALGVHRRPDDGLYESLGARSRAWP